MTLRFTMRGGYHGGRPIRPSLWCRRDESSIFSDFLRRSAGTNSTAGKRIDFLAGFTAFIQTPAISTNTQWDEQAILAYDDSLSLLLHTYNQPRYI